MTKSPTVVALQRLLTSGEPGGSGAADGELLTRFLSGRGDDALAALVRRHAPTVWGVCRRLLPHHDAEDAFQATFLVLVRKAAAIRDRDLVANWLHGVAHQTAVRVRGRAAKRGARERQVADMPEPVADEARADDLLPLLDEELARLPERFRVLILLCDLEGKTRKDVARQLGCPEGTVASRLARARAMLAKRLARRGLAVTGGALATLLSTVTASAAVPNAVVATAITSAGLMAAGPAASSGVISAAVLTLMEEGVKAMFLSKITGVLTVLLLGVLLCGAVGGGVAVLAARGDGAAPKDRADPTARDDQPASRERKDGGVPKAKDESAVRGVWTLVGVEPAPGLPRLRDGATGRWVPAAPPPVELDVSADRWVWNERGEGRAFVYDLDAAQNPKHLDLKLVKRIGPGADTLKCIYKLDGDTLTVCESSDADRPKEFKGGAGNTLFVFKRSDKPKGRENEEMEDRKKDGPPPHAKEAVTAWGKPEGGLQAGLRCARGGQTLRHGQEAEVEVVVRNVGDRPVRYTFLPPSRFWGEAETGGTVVVTVMYEGKGFPDSVTVQPGAELRLGSFSVGHVRPKDPAAAYAPRPELAPGKYQVGAESVVVPLPAPHARWKLPTGYLDIELVNAK